VAIPHIQPGRARQPAAKTKNGPDGRGNTRHGTWTIEQLAAWLNVALNDRFAGL
jgi:hypothetical protein